MSLFIDGLAFLYMLFNGILGYSRGLVDELGRLIGLVLSIIIATGQTVNISKIILGKIHLEPWLATMIAFGAVFSLIIIFSRIITRLFKIALFGTPPMRNAHFCVDYKKTIKIKKNPRRHFWRHLPSGMLTFCSR